LQSILSVDALFLLVTAPHLPTLDHSNQEMATD
jgi:hypothetical protein